MYSCFILCLFLYDNHDKTVSLDIVGVGNKYATPRRWAPRIDPPLNMLNWSYILKNTHRLKENDTFSEKNNHKNGLFFFFRKGSFFKSVHNWPRIFKCVPLYSAVRCYTRLTVTLIHTLVVSQWWITLHP